MLKDLIVKKTGQEINHCVINHYANGSDNIGAYFDKTESFAYGHCVMNINLGTQRKIVLEYVEKNPHYR